MHSTAFHKADLVLTSSRLPQRDDCYVIQMIIIIHIVCVCCCVVQRPDEEVVVDQGGTSSAMNIHYEKEELEGEERLFFSPTHLKCDNNILFPNAKTVQI